MYITVQLSLNRRHVGKFVSGLEWVGVGWNGVEWSGVDDWFVKEWGQILQ